MITMNDANLKAAEALISRAKSNVADIDLEIKQHGQAQAITAIAILLLEIAKKMNEPEQPA